MAKKSKTWVLIVLDESGSMGGLQSDVVNGINTYVRELREEKGSYVLKIVNFDSRGLTDAAGKVVRPIFDWTPLKDVPEITNKDYKPYGGTPLYDAVGQSVQGEMIPDGDKALCIVYTDGQENQSREWSATKIKALIKELESKNWAFTYMGAGLNGWTGDAINMGFALANSYASSDASGHGTVTRMSSLRAVTSSYAAGTSAVADLYTGSGVVSSMLEGETDAPRPVNTSGLGKSKKK